MLQRNAARILAESLSRSRRPSYGETGVAATPSLGEVGGLDAPARIMAGGDILHGEDGVHGRLNQGKSHAHIATLHPVRRSSRSLGGPCACTAHGEQAVRSFSCTTKVAPSFTSIPLAMQVLPCTSRTRMS